MGHHPRHKGFGHGRHGHRHGGPVQAVLSLVGFGLLVLIAVLKEFATASPALYLMLYVLVVIVGIATVFSFLRPSAGTPSVQEQLASRVGEAEMLDLAGARIAISGRALDELQSVLRSMRGTASVREVQAVVGALLAQSEAWVFTSLESTPRRPFSQLASLAARLMSDAERRFPPPTNAASAANAALAASPSADPFRATHAPSDAVFVVSVVFTSRANIGDHNGESHQETRALLEEMSTLAGQVHTLDVHVSGLLSIDELAKRDPAMRGIA